MSVHPESLNLLPVNFDLEKPTGKPGELSTFTDPETGLSLDVYGVDRRSPYSKNTVLVFQPWSDYVARPFAQQRMDLIANTLDARVIGVDNLGVGIGTSDIPGDGLSMSQRLHSLLTGDGLPDSMRHKISQGDFSDVSKLQWKAILASKLFDQNDDNSLAYYSLGTSMAMLMAAHAPKGVQIDRMILWDCAAIEPQAFGKLALTYLWDGGKGWKQYLSENPEWVEKPSGIGHLVKRIMEQPAGHWVYPRGMAQKTAFHDMEMAHDRGVLSPDSIIHVINGSESKVSPTRLNDEFAAQLGALRHPTPEVLRLTLQGEKHAIQDSFPRTARVLGHIARQHAL